MSTEVYARMRDRETQLWRPFLFDVERYTEAAAEKVVLFGLYSRTYVLGQNYLADIEAEQLAWLLSEYNTKVSLLTSEQAALTLQIAAKKYIANLDLLLMDEKIKYEEQKNTKDAAYWAARSSAVTSDREAIDSRRIALEITQEKVAQRLLQIENDIALEGLRQSEIDLEASKRDLDVTKAANESAKVDIEVIKLQQRVSEIALDMIRVDNQLGDIEIDILSVENRTARLALTALDLEIEKIERDSLQYRATNDKTTRQSVIDSKVETIEADTTNLGVIEGLITDKKDNRIQQITDNSATDISILETRDTAAQELKKIKSGTFPINEIMASQDSANRVKIAEKSTETDTERQNEAASDYSTASYIAYILASAKIVNTLEHSIEAG